MNQINSDEKGHPMINLIILNNSNKTYLNILLFFFIVRDIKLFIESNCFYFKRLGGLPGIEILD